MTNIISRAKNLILDLLFPKFCASCRKEGEFLCQDCAGSLSIHTSSCMICSQRNLTGRTCVSCRKKTHIVRLIAPFSYKNGTIRSLIHLYKYGRVKEIGPILASFLVREMKSNGFRTRMDLVLIPIPLHRRRERERGFNQSVILANAVGQEFGIPVAAQALCRIKFTPPQIEMEDNADRCKNVKGAFVVKDAYSIENKIAILVDDVMTSGATLDEAAKVLREAGCRSVWAIVVARR